MVEDQKPSGKLTLIDYFKESSSGHYDETREVTLSAIDNDYSVMLSEYEKQTDQYKSGSDISQKYWKIDRELLIQLIQERGTRVR
jgi:hypothetical protein